MGLPATVVLHRPPAWTDSLRAYRFVVDSEVRGRIRRGEMLSFEIQPERNWARARIDWTGSPRLEFEAGLRPDRALGGQAATEPTHGAVVSTRHDALVALIADLTVFPRSPSSASPRTDLGPWVPTAVDLAVSR